MAYPNAGPGMYNSYLALVGVYKLLVINNIIKLHIHVYTMCNVLACAA